MPFPMTKNGAEALRLELEHLKLVERPRIIEAIAEARALGDLKENAEYHSARERQSFIEGRIKDIETKLADSHIINVTEIPNNGRVIFGTTVLLEDLDSGEKITYRIVGEDEADVNKGLISNTSPIARELMGKEEGDVAEVITPSGTREYEIIQVQYI